MGTRLPSASAPDVLLGSNAETMYWLQEKRGWQFDRSAQGSKTLSILRYTEHSGISYYLVEPTYNLVSGLTNLPCFFDDSPKAYKRKFGALVENATCTFILYDVPGGDVSKQDILIFEGDEYLVIDSLFEPASGRTEVLSKYLQSA